MNKKPDVPILIIHFNPLERYPPVQNLMDYLGVHSKRKVVVISTFNINSALNNYENSFENIIIKRTVNVPAAYSFRVFYYISFYSKCLYWLMKYRPKSVLYFETISSWAALFYKKMKGEKVKLLVHYHEYSCPQEYEHGMRLVKSMHQTECKMYSSEFDWISQTNEVRLKKFITDNSLENVDQSVFHTMPNYPSKYWAKEKKTFHTTGKLRLVYVGSLGYDTTYLEEITEWVLLNKAIVSLDIFSDNIDDKAKDFLQAINDDAISFHGGCIYKELPEKLKNYDVGLVMYKPVSDNWIQNAPNKLFEYLACGLDVWFSKTMAYTLTLERRDLYPKIIALDFEKLDGFDFEKAVNRDGLLYKEPAFFYEDVYGEICYALCITNQREIGNE